MSWVVNKKLIAIFVLALFLRLWALSAVPSGFHNDEVDVGYVGKFILLNGRDPAGHVLPLYFNKFGDFRPTGLFYLAGLSELALGSSKFAVRLPTALFGALSVFAIFFLARELFKKDEPAYFAALFLAILPWHIVLSRAGHEAIVGYFLVVWGLGCLLRYRGGGRSRYLIWGSVLIATSYLFYHGTRVVVPLALLGLVFVWGWKTYGKVFVILSVLTALIIVSPLGRGRLSQVVFYKDPGLAKRPNELAQFDGGNILSARIFHNKVVVLGRSVVGQYLQYFGADFLFLRGGFPERYLIPEDGLVYLTLAPFLVVGIATLARQRKTALPIFWLLVAPIPAVLTYEDIPNVARSSFMIIPLVLLAGWGFWVVVQSLGRYRYLITVFFLSLLLEGIYFGHQDTVHQKSFKAILRDEGNREVAQYINREKRKYDLVVAPYGPNLPFYYLFFANDFSSKIRIDISDQHKDRFMWGNVLFVRDGCPAQRENSFDNLNVLYINDADCHIQNKRKVADFIRHDSTVAFDAFVKE